MVMGGAMSYFMTLKFNIYISLVVQIVTMPLNLYENILFKKYVLGVTKKEDGSLLYGEVFTQPTVESLAAAERIRAAVADKKSADTTTADEDKANLTASVAKSAIPKGEARVEELSEEDDKKTSSKKKSTAAAAVKEEVKEAPSSESLNNID